MDRHSRRDLMRYLGATAATVVLGPAVLDHVSALTLKVTIRGRLTTLREVSGGLTTLTAQWAYHPYQQQQYQMWAQWNWMQYQAYMQQLAAQHAWIQAYHASMAQQMQTYYGRGYTMSQPFAMDAVRSVYSYGEDRRGDDVIMGMNRYRSHVEARGASARLVSAIEDIGDDEGWDEDDVERAAGPQSSSRRRTESVGGRSLTGDGFRTAAGTAFVSDRKFQDEESGERGQLVVFDSASGKERRLVPLYD